MRSPPLAPRRQSLPQTHNPIVCRGAGFAKALGWSSSRHASAGITARCAIQFNTGLLLAWTAAEQRQAISSRRGAAAGRGMRQAAAHRGLAAGARLAAGHRSKAAAAGQGRCRAAGGRAGARRLAVALHSRAAGHRRQAAAARRTAAAAAAACQRVGRVDSNHHRGPGRGGEAREGLWSGHRAAHWRGWRHLITSPDHPATAQPQDPKHLMALTAGGGAGAGGRG